MSTHASLISCGPILCMNGQMRKWTARASSNEISLRMGVTYFPMSSWWRDVVKTTASSLISKRDFSWLWPNFWRLCQCRDWRSTPCTVKCFEYESQLECYAWKNKKELLNECELLVYELWGESEASLELIAWADDILVQTFSLGAWFMNTCQVSVIAVFIALSSY